MSESSDRGDRTQAGRPSAWWYVFGAAMAIGGVVSFVVALGLERGRIEQAVRSMPRLILPAGGWVDISEAGLVRVYYEGPAEGAAWLPYDRIRPQLEVLREGAGGTIEVSDDGAAVVEAYPLSDGGQAFVVARFEAPSAGRYRVTGTLAGDQETAGAKVALGHVSVRRILGDWTGVFGGAVAATLGLVVGAVVVLVTASLRRGEVTARPDEAEQA